MCDKPAEERAGEDIHPKCVSLCLTCCGGSEPLNNMPLNTPWQIIQSHLIKYLLMNLHYTWVGSPWSEALGRMPLMSAWFISFRDTGLSCRGPTFCGRWGRNSARWPSPERAIFEKIRWNTGAGWSMWHELQSLNSLENIYRLAQDK